MTETTLRACDGHVSGEPAGDYETFLQDPAFEPFRDALIGMVKTLETDTMCVLGWLKEGLEAGGQLAFISMMIAVADYDNEVHPRHILDNLWHAYDAACDQVPKGVGPGAEMRRLRALAVPRRPAILDEVTT